MSFLRIRQPVVTRLFPHQANRRFNVPNVAPLGNQLIPEPRFVDWDGAANPNNFPIGWNLSGQVASAFFEPGPGGIGCRLLNNIGDNVNLVSAGELPVVGVEYLVQWIVAATVNGDARLNFAGGNVTLAGADNALNEQTILATTTAAPNLQRLSDLGLTDVTLAYLSIREVQRK